MGCATKPHFLNIWNAKCIFPQKHHHGYSIQMGLTNSSSLPLFYVLPLWLDWYSSWDALYPSSPSYPKQLMPLTTSSNAVPPRFWTDGANHCIPRTQVLFMALCSGQCGNFLQHLFYLLQPIVFTSGFWWDGAHPFPGAGAMPLRIIPPLLT